jgi:ADP-ribose pyrophosphatase
MRGEPSLMGEDFEYIDEETCYRGAFLSLAKVRYRSPRGESLEREVVRHPGAVTVVPLFDDNEIVALWQFRVAIGREVLEVCAGKRDVEGEPPILTAERELREELGLEAKVLLPLGTLFNSPGFCSEETQVFVAFGLSKVDRDPQGTEEMVMRSSRFSLGRFPTLVGAGAIHDAKTIASITMLQSFLLSEEAERVRREAGGDSVRSLEFSLS